MPKAVLTEMEQDPDRVSVKWVEDDQGNDGDDEPFNGAEAAAAYRQRRFGSRT